MDEFYFYARYQKGKVETRGRHHNFLGHRVDHTPGRKSDGIFVEWSWDGNTLSVENDRYGMYPLYYYTKNGEICVSPSITRVLAEGAPNDLDYRALSVFLRIGFFIGDDTPFKAIRAVPPNAVFQWTNGKLEVSGKFDCGGSHKEIPYDDALDRHIALFRQSIKRRLPTDENFAVPISGGRDSRQILFVLNELGYTPKSCMTSRLFPPQNHEDIDIAKIITKRLNIEHFILDQKDAFFNTEMKRNVVTNFCSDELQESFGCADYYRGKTNVLYDGLAGAVVSAGFFVNEHKVNLLKAGKLRELSDEIIKGWNNDCFSEDVFKSLFRDEYQKLMGREEVIEYITSELKRHMHTPNPLMQFVLWNRTRREITLSPNAILGNIKTVYSPYLDHDLYDFLSALDPKYFLDRMFHTRAILRAYPKFNDIRFEDKSIPGQDPRGYRNEFVGKLLVHIIKEMKSAGKYTRIGYMMPRLLQYLVKGNNWWVCPPKMLYLIQLEKTRVMKKDKMIQYKSELINK
ncbi:MAG: hypothetical protein KAS66_04670 [Candidatus Omnitrophica bacterium]|nr:hypothetical protein [Candidatus Omnitrophota bacterium]